MLVFMNPKYVTSVPPIEVPIIYPSAKLLLKTEDAISITILYWTFGYMFYITFIKSGITGIILNEFPKFYKNNAIYWK